MVFFKKSVGRPHGAAVAAVVGAAVLWSSSYAVTKLALEEVGPVRLGAVRFTVAALLLFVLVTISRLPRPDGVTRRLLWLSGLLGITVYFCLENVGVDFATASDASLIVASYPLMTMTLECFQQRRPPGVHRVAGIVLAIVGTFFVVRSGTSVGGSQRYLGDVLLLIGGLVWALYSLLAQRAGRGLSAVNSTYHQTVAGAAGFVVASSVEFDAPWRVPSLRVALLVLFLALGCSILAFVLYNHGLRALPSSVATNILNLVPVFGVTFAVLLNGETLSMVQVCGGALTVMGVGLGLVRITSDRTPEKEGAEHVHAA